MTWYSLQEDSSINDFLSIHCTSIHQKNIFKVFTWKRFTNFEWLLTPARSWITSRFYVCTDIGNILKNRARIFNVFFTFILRSFYVDFTFILRSFYVHFTFIYVHFTFNLRFYVHFTFLRPFYVHFTSRVHSIILSFRDPPGQRHVS